MQTGGEVLKKGLTATGFYKKRKISGQQAKLLLS